MEGGDQDFGDVGFRFRIGGWAQGFGILGILSLECWIWA